MIDHGWVQFAVAQHPAKSLALPDDPIRAGNLVDRIQYAVFEPLIIAVAMTPPLPDNVGVRALGEEMVPLRQPASLPSPADQTFLPIPGESWDAICMGHREIAPMPWGSRVVLDAACDAIRSWTTETLP